MELSAGAVAAPKTQTETVQIETQPPPKNITSVTAPSPAAPHPLSNISRTPSSSSWPSTAEQGPVIKHGVLLDYSLRVGGHLRSVLFHPSSQAAVLQHAKGFHVCTRSSVEEEYLNTTETLGIERLLFAEEYGVYVGVCKRHLKLLNKKFACFYERESEARFTSAIFNSCSGEVLTSGPGNITTWMFRQGAKVIAPSQVITDGLLPTEEAGLLHLEDVPGRAQRCFAAVRCGIKVFLLSSGKLLTDLPDLHLRPITALLFFRPLKLLITAAKDGAIKVWDSSWGLCCSLVGHRAAVTCLAPYPYGPMVLSGSLDCSLYVWNLNTQDKVERLDHAVPVEGLYAEPGSLHLLSHSGRLVKGWRVQQLYRQSTVIGSHTHFLQRTTHPKVPLRIVAACEDAAVRVVSPATGLVLNTALLPLGSKITAVAYFSFRELLYVLDGCGSIVAFDARENPSTRMASWHSPEDIGQYSCLALYEITMDEEDIVELLSSDQWLGVVLEAERKNRLRLRDTQDPLQKEMEGQSLLLAGTSRGFLVLVDHEDGSARYSVKAHEGSVTMIACNPRRSQVISASTGNVVNIWRLYPHTQEALSLMMSFRITSCPSLMVASRERLCIACNDHIMGSYSLDMYSLTEQTCFTGQPEHSHSDAITGLDSYPRLKLFASCGKDHTLRIWSEDNHPIRVLQLNVAPEGLAFSSHDAHITLSLHAHLHTVINTTYIPEPLQKQLVSIQFPKGVEEGSPRGFTVDLETLPPEDRQRLELVDNTIQQDSYKGALSQEEMELLEQASHKKTLALALLQERDRELRMIRDGQLTSSKKRSGLQARDREKAWQSLLAILHPRKDPRLVIPEEDDFDPDTFGRELEEPEPYSPYQRGQRYKFFPPLATFDPPYPVAPDGLLPNSVLLQQLRKSEADRAMAEQWVPPTLSEKQLRLMAEMEEQEEEEEEEEEEEGDSDLMARLQAALTTELEPPSPSPSPTPPPTPPEPPQRKIVPHKPIQKLTAPRPPPKPPTPPKSPSPPPPPKSPTPPPTPPPPPTPLPEFISQFIGQAWFDRLFPNANSKTFPKPWSVTRFVYSLLSCLDRPLDSYTKGDICEAILKLVRQHSPSNREDITKTLLAQLSGPPTPTTKTPPEKHFVLRGLQLVLHLRELSSRLVAVMLVHLAQGERDVRSLVLAQLASHGVEDPHGYLLREMEGLGGQGLEATELLSKCQEWLSSWAEQLLHSRAPKGPKRAPTKKAIKTGAQSGKMGKQKVSQVTFVATSSPTLPPYNPIEVINYFVMVEHENELARQRAVTPPPPPPPEPPAEELPHNTVVALPRIAQHRGLARLGETHCSCCHPERETSLALMHRLPRLPQAPPTSADPTRLWRTFTRALTLALKPQNINPFLTEEERLEAELEENQRHVSIASVMKYFIPEQSYVRTQQ